VRSLLLSTLAAIARAEPASGLDAANPAHVEHERRMNALVDRVAAGDSLCLQH